ncbi:MAG TPA: hypothetical protein VK457_17825 [Chloroflexota bacterium]|nr:hypothetical protein [Chloroflexota bacterium]
MAAVVLDAGAVIGFVGGDKRIAALIKAAAVSGMNVVLPPIVVTQTIRGGGRDTRIHQLLHQGCRVPATDIRVARRAGELLGATGKADAADAQVAAHCLDALPVTLVTSDPEDMTELLTGHSGIRILSV